MPHCPECDFPIQPHAQDECLKCGCVLVGQTLAGILEIDIVHSGESWERARIKILDSFDQALRDQHAGLKVIHGYGSNSGGKSIIAPRAISYLRHLADEHGGRYTKDRHNPGASIVWLNR